jgi:hypothetical protein
MVTPVRQTGYGWPGRGAACLRSVTGPSAAGARCRQASMSAEITQ